MATTNQDRTRPATLAEGLETLNVGAHLAANKLLGPYKLVRQLGEGGMGVVWLADQLQPFERKVAIKLSNRQAGSNLADAYFEIERQALAQLVHPYIAQIYDAGVRADGMLYFAMEYVDGCTLDDFLQDKPISLDACIALLVQICQGVHYAHQRGLIHRDLKPGNILIAEVSDSPMPKIIDFGIAIGVDTARTGTSASAGTRAYMAPEQFSTHATGIDLRVDVYALGAMLVEALCLLLKIPIEGIDSGTFRGLLSAAGTSAEIQGQQSHVPASLKGELRRIPKALRSIAIKAMAVDRELRYESAAAMADDLKRWRERRPVLAMQGGKLYAVQCFVNRYRLASALGLATLIALVGGLIVASYGLREAQIAKAQAELRREQAEGLVDYMLGDFAAKLEPIGKLDLIDGVANRALEYLQQANDSDQSSAIHRAAALRTIGDVQTRRGQWPQAKATFELADAALIKAVQANPGEPTVELLFEQAQVAYWIGYTYYNERDYATTKIHWQRYLDFALRLQPLTVKTGLGLEETGYALNNMGTLAFATGEIEGAANLFSQAIALRQQVVNISKNEKNLVNLSGSISWLAKTQESIGQIASALASYQLQLSMLEETKIYDPTNIKSHINILYARHLIAQLELRLGRTAQSAKNLEFVVNELESVVKLDSTQAQWKRQLATARSDLAWTLFFQKNLSLAALNIDKVISESAGYLKPGSSIRDRRFYATALLRKSAILEALGEFKDSDRYFAEATAQILALHIENPSDRSITFMRISSLISHKKNADTLSSLLAANELLKPLVEKQVDAEALEALVRVNILMGNTKNAQRYEEKLAQMQYNHPHYRNFLAIHRKGLKP